LRQARPALGLLVALMAGVACSSVEPQAAPAASQASNCLPGDRGYLRASLRGALDADLDWRAADLQCEGGARPDTQGLRVSFAGPGGPPGTKLRIVIGIAARPGLATAANLPTNVTVIVEGQDRLYATQGYEKCRVESLQQQPLAADSVEGRAYRIAARGYCVDPAATLDGSDRLYINRFDFAGLARFEDNDLHEPTDQPTPDKTAAY
jgi:hypothetical protein